LKVLVVVEKMLSVQTTPVVLIYVLLLLVAQVKLTQLQVLP
jgi:hypothetical protein